MYSHFRAVAEAVDIPIVLYNIPARTGVNLAYQTVKKLARIPNIAGIKDSSGNFDNILRYIEETRDIEGKSFRVVSGNDSLILWTLLAGGSGGISGVSNVLPEIMASIYDLWMKGDFEGARKGPGLHTAAPRLHEARKSRTPSSSAPQTSGAKNSAPAGLHSTLHRSR
ncbi:dihydrodipicolinate synthase family protein [Aminivibrio sp.]|uniref:dihydrodipicolinate synthase family protein n=1 Tax=Aminivibrio sp. TaxID=1872489 RepID=UPI003D97831F